MNEERERLDLIEPEEQSNIDKAKRRKILRIVGAIVFVLLNALVLFFIARNDFSKDAPPITSAPFRGKNLLCLFCAIGCLLLAIAAETIKFLMMMHRLGERISLRAAFETVVLGKYYDYITPSGVGGQPFQIWNLHAKGYSSGAASAMPLASFVMMQFGFVLIALSVFIFNNDAVDTVAIKIAAYVGLVAYMIVPIMIVLSAISPAASAKVVGFFVKIGAKLRILKHPERTAEKAENALLRYSDSLKTIAKSPALLVALFLFSVLYQAAICSIPYFVVQMFGGRLGFIQSLSMCVYVYFSVTIIPTPGNAGAAEGSFYILFNQLDTSGLFWAMLIWRFLTYYIFLVMGLLIYAVRALERLIRRRRAEP